MWVTIERGRGCSFVSVLKQILATTGCFINLLETRNKWNSVRANKKLRVPHRNQPWERLKQVLSRQHAIEENELSIEAEETWHRGWQSKFWKCNKLAWIEASVDRAWWGWWVGVRLHYIVEGGKHFATTILGNYSVWSLEECCQILEFYFPESFYSNNHWVRKLFRS